LNLSWVTGTENLCRSRREDAKIRAGRSQIDIPNDVDIGEVVIVSITVCFYAGRYRERQTALQDSDVIQLLAVDHLPAEDTQRLRFRKLIECGQNKSMTRISIRSSKIFGYHSDRQLAW
jgi:hypothetical protein